MVLSCVPVAGTWAVCMKESASAADRHANQLSGFITMLKLHQIESGTVRVLMLWRFFLPLRL